MTISPALFPLEHDDPLYTANDTLDLPPVGRTESLEDATQLVDFEASPSRSGVPVGAIDPRVDQALDPHAKGAQRGVEHPLNESVRGMLRMEHLLQRWQLLVSRPDAVDHHHALLTAFEIMEVAARRDMRRDLQQELEHQRRHLDAFRDNPAIAEEVLDQAIRRIDDVLSALAHAPERIESVLAANDFLIAIRSRAAIAGGLCAFDLPAYAHWQQSSPEQRRDDLHRWISVPLVPLAEALDIALNLIRESGATLRLVALDGRHIHKLTAQRPGQRQPQIAKVTFDRRSGVVPEITANRLQLSVQFTRPDKDGNLVHDIGDAPFELTLCA